MFIINTRSWIYSAILFPKLFEIKIKIPLPKENVKINERLQLFKKGNLNDNILIVRRKLG